MFLLTAILLGLTGSLHCVGMCGPIALALPVAGESPLRKTLLIFLYNLGRSITYSVLGIAAGLVGLGIVLSGYQQLLSISMGVLIISSAFFPFLIKLPIVSPFLTWLRTSMHALFRTKAKKDILLFGILNGLLPCGMVYMALAIAVATGNMLQGALFMFVFGLGTFPLMMILPLTGGLITGKVRVKLRRLVPAITVCMGLLLLLRGLNLGIPYVSPRLHGNEMQTCHQADHHSLKTISCTGPDSQATR
jgi:sulfite exporter TauE/SafE